MIPWAVTEVILKEGIGMMLLTQDKSSDPRMFAASTSYRVGSFALRPGLLSDGREVKLARHHSGT